MRTLTIETFINAPAEICFDLMRDERVHHRSRLKIEGCREIALGQRVTFTTGSRPLTVEVVQCEVPVVFVDEMVRGPFKSFRHIHEFKELDQTTRLIDTLMWESPFGVIGKLADKLIERRLRKVATERNQRLRELAENR